MKSAYTKFGSVKPGSPAASPLSTSPGCNETTLVASNVNTKKAMNGVSKTMASRLRYSAELFKLVTH